ncbi:hypothetical protein [Rosenbergiella epipactidis]|uniref:hypothetical protein n=1 Tax=Rosenbergiella epipactidis TaxID=1544694 RepID=UPI001F4E3933|nr:hypothetical protein [Rosenbergiella epipactidis]
MLQNELAKGIFSLLQEEKNDHPQNMSKPAFMAKLIGNEITEKMLHEAVNELYRYDLISFSDRGPSKSQSTPYPLAYSSIFLKQNLYKTSN